MKFYFSFFIIIVCPNLNNLLAQENLYAGRPIHGLDFNVVPSFTYNPDRGLQYGLLASIYYYNDSTRYPEYLYNLYLLLTRTTQQGYAYHLFFDSKYLVSKKIRLLADMSFRRNRYEQFYGFNGYNSLYHSDYEDPSKKDYISLHYYDFHKTTYSILLGIQGQLPWRHFLYSAGIGYYNAQILPFIDKNKPVHPVTLFEKYITNRVIPPDQVYGGITTYLKAGIIYDSRDNEAVPTKGIWFESIYCNAPSFLYNKLVYSQAAIIYRQYLPLNPRLVFAYRLAYQTKLSGQMPYYMFPYLLSTYWTTEALGGVKSIRGVHNQRLEGNGYGLINLEFRYFMLNTVLLRKNLGIALNAFSDMGKVTELYAVNPSLNYTAFDYMPDQEKMHYGVGGGIRFIINHNFIGAFDCGQPLNNQDGRTAFYVDIDYLF